MHRQIRTKISSRSDKGKHQNHTNVQLRISLSVEPPALCKIHDLSSTQPDKLYQSAHRMLFRDGCLSRLGSCIPEIASRSSALVCILSDDVGATRPCEVLRSFLKRPTGMSFGPDAFEPLPTTDAPDRPCKLSWAACSLPCKVMSNGCYFDKLHNPY